MLYGHSIVSSPPFPDQNIQWSVPVMPIMFAILLVGHIPYVVIFVQFYHKKNVRMYFTVVLA